MLQVKHHQTGHKFWDDCGAWNGSTGRILYAKAQSFTQLCILPGGLYGQRKRVDGSRVIVALDPQSAAVIEVHQLCSRLKCNGRYRRRITYVTDYGRPM